ncbi:MAG: translocation/assembly module TamB domain-containing protein [Pseudomonadota bacterium]
MSARRFRWLRRTALAVLVLLVTLVAVASWLAGTTSGARFVVDRAVGYAPGTLAIAEVDGTLIGGLTLRGVAFTDDAIATRIDALTVRVAPSVVINWRRVRVRELTLSGVILTLPESSVAEPAPPSGPPRVPAIALDPLPVAIDIVRLSIDDIRVVRGSAPETVVTRLVFSGELDGQNLDVREFSVDAAMGRAELAGRVRLAPDLRARLTLDWLLRGDADVGGSLIVSGSRERYEIRHELTAPFTVTTTGTVALPIDASPQVDLESTASRVAYATALQEVVATDLVVVVAGQAEDWRITASTDLDGEGLSGLAVSLEANGDLREVVLDSLELNEAGVTRLSAAGSARFLETLDWDATLELRQLSTARLLPEIDAVLNGVLSAEGALGVEPTVRVTTDGVEGRWRDYAVTVVGGARVAADAVTFDALRASVGDNALSLAGTLGGATGAELDVVLQAPDVSAFWPGLSGAAFAEGRVAGTLAAPEIALALKVPQLSYGDLALTALSGRVRADAGVAGDFDVDLAAANVRSGDTSAESLRVSVTGPVDNHVVAFEGASGPVTRARVRATGGYLSQQWTGRVTLAELSIAPPDAAPEDWALESPVAMTASAETIRFEQGCLTTASSSRLCLDALLTPNEIEAQTSLERLDLATWLPQLAGGLEIAGQASASLQLKGPRQRLSGAAAFGIDGLEIAQGEGDARNRVAFDDAKASLLLDAGLLTATLGLEVTDGGALDAEIDVGDAYAPDDALSGTVTLSVPDVTALNVLSDALTFSEGALEGEVLIAGTRLQPRIETDFDATAIRARLLPLGIELRELRFNAASTDSGRIRVEAAGRSGEGSFSLEGNAQLRGDGAPNARASVTATRLTFLDLPDATGVASLDINVEATPERQSLSGSLAVDSAAVTIRGLPASAVRVSDDIVVVAEAEADDADDSPQGPLRTVDVDVVLSEDVRLEGFGLKTRLNGALKLTKRPSSDLAGTGSLQLEDATYEAYGQALEVSRGQLVFNGPLDAPVLDIRAERTVDETRVGIDIDGTPDALSSTLFSEPSLPDAEAFSLLLTGRPLESAGESGDTALADAALTLGLKRAFGVSSAIRDAVGLDTLTVAGSGRDGRVLAGKQLSKDLYLEYAYGVFDQVSTVLVRLQLNKRLALESQSGDTQSVDLVYSVGSR